MIRRIALSLSSLSLLLVACGGDNPPPQTPPPPAPTAEPKAAETAPVPTTPPAPPEPTAEEKKKAEDKKQLDADRADWDKKHSAEVARWTPEMHAAAKALAEKSWPNGKAAITEIAKGKHRAAGNAERDKARHPIETLEFFGFKPNMSVLDIGPGEGWYTELLAPATAKSGHYYATNGDPNGPPDVRGTFYAQRFKQFLETSPEAYGKTELVVVDGKAPKLNMDGKLDMAIIMRGVHGMVNGKTFDTWLDEINKALKPNGVLGIEEHRAKADANVEESAKKGYVPEKFVIEQAEKHGFKLAGKSEINANPKDTKDYPDGVWDLPPTLRKGDTDKDKYNAIGESDRMTLKFVKVPPKSGSQLPAPLSGDSKAAPKK